MGSQRERTDLFVEAVKAMIHDQHLPMFLWEEASMTVVHLHSISPHKTLRNMTLKENFTGVNSKVGHFIGC